MYIGRNYKAHKVEFGYIDIGVPFYAYDYERNKNILYMKIDEAFFFAIISGLQFKMGI